MRLIKPVQSLFNEAQVALSMERTVAEKQTLHIPKEQNFKKKKKQTTFF